MAGIDAAEIVGDTPGAFSLAAALDLGAPAIEAGGRRPTHPGGPRGGVAAPHTLPGVDEFAGDVVAVDGR